MSITSFDTHQLALNLKQAGFNDAQAAALLSAVKAARQESDLVSKSDLRQLEQSMTLKLLMMQVATIGILAVLMKVL